MRRFILKLLLFGLLQLALFGFLVSRYDVSDESNYLAATVDKHRRLKNISHPCIVLAGGSSVPFGFESDSMESALGLPVVNMGLAAGLGAEFMMSEIEPDLGPGDFVVLSFEYDHFARGLRSGRYLGVPFDARMLSQVLVFRPEAALALGFPHFRRVVLDSGITVLGEMARRSFRFGGDCGSSETRESRSTRAAFNAWGDFVGHRRESPRTTAESIEAAPLIAHAAGFPSVVLLQRIREFVGRCQARDVRVAFTFPPRSTGTLARDGHLAGRLAVALRQIPGLIVLDMPQDHAYPPNQFFDTQNHLTGAGAAERTARVAASLEPFVRVVDRSGTTGSGGRLSAPLAR